MARIRSIKPTFWTDEKVVETSPWARLLFIGTWNFCDDEGRMEYSPKRLKMQIFPGDSVEVGELVGELVEKKQVFIYDVDGKQYLQVVNFQKHQHVDKRMPSKYPAPRDVPPNSAELPGKSQGREGKGMEGNGMDSTPANAGVAKPPAPPCPHEEIIDAYHEALPMGRGVKLELWRGQRSARLLSRWREDSKRQSVAWWRDLFGHIAESAFLTGQKHSPGREPFLISLDWILKPENLAKIIEGEYTRNR